MTRIRKKITGWKNKQSGTISFNPDELRTAGIAVGDYVEVEAERDRIVVYRLSDTAARGR